MQVVPYSYLASCLLYHIVEVLSRFCPQFCSFHGVYSLRETSLLCFVPVRSRTCRDRLARGSMGASRRRYSTIGWSPRISVSPILSPEGLFLGHHHAAVLVGHPPTTLPTPSVLYFQSRPGASGLAEKQKKRAGRCKVLAALGEWGEATDDPTHNVRASSRRPCRRHHRPTFMAVRSFHSLAPWRRVIPIA